MRIGFDLSPARGHGSLGVRRAAQGLFGALVARGVHEWVALAPEPGDNPFLWRQGRLPRALETAGCWGWHSTVSALPFGLALPLVQTVHELPWRHGVREGAGPGARAWAALGARRARAVLVPSLQTAEDWSHEHGAQRDRLALVPWGGAEELDPLDPDRARAAVGRRLGFEGPYWLMLSADRQKKRLLAVARALAQAPAPLGLPLVVSGKPGRILAEASALLGARLISIEGELGGPWPEPERCSLLSGAAGLISAARSEGFCFPVLEALSVGTPAIVVPGSGPDRTFAPRALVADPEPSAGTPETFHSALGRALLASPEDRAANRRSVLGFTWAQAAQRVEALWERFL